MQITKDSHLDHGLSAGQLEYVMSLFRQRNSFFIETITLPEEFGTVSCGLRGPVVGDNPISDGSSFSLRRGEREYDSRMTTLPPTVTREVTVIAGPHESNPCVLYTMYGGPCAPREIGDLDIASTEERANSEKFWAEHALSISAG